MGQGAGVSHASQPFQPSGSMPGSALPRSPSLSSFSSMGCEDPRVPVLITDERCRAWTPGLTSQHDSLWDHFSPDGIAWLALSPQIKCSACYCSVSYVCACVCVCVNSWVSGSKAPLFVLQYSHSLALPRGAAQTQTATRWHTVVAN